MSTFTCEPGARIGDRYRLEDRISAGGGWSEWKAIDEILARPVTILTFVPGFARMAEVVHAARAASRLTDARLSQVFDVEEGLDQAYVVMEWVGGDSLGDLLASGPLEPARGAWIVGEAADALASAHAAGLAHLCLTPASVRYAPGGGVKVVGLGIDAALAGATHEDPGRADTRGLARLLYAALTAHWPGPGWPALPPAPEIDGELLSPRQVRAGVPAAMDEVTIEALLQRPRRGHPPLTSPGLFADALAEVMPAPSAPPAAVGHGATPTLGPGDPYWQPEPGYRAGGAPRQPAGPRQRPRRGRAALTIVTLLALSALALGAWTLTHHTAPTAKVTGQRHVSHHVTEPHPTFTTLTPVKATAPGENNRQARYAIDGSLTTAWHTQYYLNSPFFGHLKSGTGLILDMGAAPVSLHTVTVWFGPTAGADANIELGNSDAGVPRSLQNFTTVASASGISGKYTFTVNSHVTGKYLLIWLTKLPPQAHGPANHYEAEIFNVVVTGTR